MAAHSQGDKTGSNDSEDTLDTSDPVDLWQALNVAPCTNSNNVERLDPSTPQKELTHKATPSLMYPETDKSQQSEISNFTSPLCFKTNVNGSHRLESKHARAKCKKAEKKAEEELNAQKWAKAEAERVELKRRLQELGDDQPPAPTPGKSKTAKMGAKSGKGNSDGEVEGDGMVSQLQ